MDISVLWATLGHFLSRQTQAHNSNQIFFISKEITTKYSLSQETYNRNPELCILFTLKLSNSNPQFQKLNNNKSVLDFCVQHDSCYTFLGLSSDLIYTDIYKSVASFPADHTLL